VVLRDRFAWLEAELLRELQRHYGDRLVSAVLFGSVGRGSPHPHSDVDVLVIAEGLPNGRMKRSSDFAAVEDALGRQLGTLRAEGIHTRLSPVLKTPAEANEGSILFLDFLDDAKVLVDRDGFFQGVLAKLRGRLDELGARRVWIGSAWYWDLKPDFKPGEVFEL
jgi:hypothetical protein